jgi:hypothetical protein
MMASRHVELGAVIRPLTREFRVARGGCLGCGRDRPATPPAGRQVDGPRPSWHAPSRHRAPTTVTAAPTLLACRAPAAPSPWAVAMPLLASRACWGQLVAVGRGSVAAATSLGLGLLPHHPDGSSLLSRLDSAHQAEDRPLDRLGSGHAAPIRARSGSVEQTLAKSGTGCWGGGPGGSMRDNGSGRETTSATAPPGARPERGSGEPIASPRNAAQGRRLHAGGRHRPAAGRAYATASTGREGATLIDYGGAE